MDPIENKIFPPRSCRAAIHDGKNMASGVTIRCHGNGSNIGDYKLGLAKSRLQLKSQGWARLSKVLKIVPKSKGQVGKSKLVVVFSILEADAEKPRTRSCTRTSRASGKHYIYRLMALSESGCMASTGVGIPTNSWYTDYFQDSVFLYSCCCDLSQKKIFHVLSKPRFWFLELALGISLNLYY